jgi:hypothetical protein
LREAGALNPWFPCEKWGSFWKEYFLPRRCFKVLIGSLCFKLAYSAVLKKHMFLCKEHLLCKKKGYLTPCFSVKPEWVFERNTSCNVGVSTWWYTLFISSFLIEFNERNTYL